MKNLLGLGALIMLAAGPAQAQEGGPEAQVVVLEVLPPDLETALALSALPPHLRSEATVYYLDPEVGFEVAREGTNGFHALVARTDPSAFRGSWPFHYRDDILLPIAFDEAGARANMQVYLDIASLQARGTSAPDLKRIINQRYQSGHYRAPERAGVAYMLAPVLRGYRNAERTENVSTVNFPHYMFYAPGVTNEDVGGHRHHVFVFAAGPHGYIIHLASDEERAAINQEHADLVARLCDLREEFCLSQALR